eukprot:gene6084-7370_t
MGSVRRIRATEDYVLNAAQIRHSVKGKKCYGLQITNNYSALTCASTLFAQANKPYSDLVVVRSSHNGMFMIYEDRNYRLFVVFHLPGLQNLDEVEITDRERSASRQLFGTSSIQIDSMLRTDHRLSYQTKAFDSLMKSSSDRQRHATLNDTSSSATSNDSKPLVIEALDVSSQRSTQAENGPRNQNESQCDVHNDSVTQDILTDSSRLQRCVSDIMALCRRAVLNPETMDDSFSNKIHRSIQQHILVPQNGDFSSVSDRLSRVLEENNQLQRSLNETTCTIQSMLDQMRLPINPSLKPLDAMRQVLLDARELIKDQEAQIARLKAQAQHATHLSEENFLLKSHLEELRTAHKQEKSTVHDLQEVQEMLRQSHRSLTLSNEQLLRELEETRSSHHREINRMQWNFEELQKTMELIRSQKRPATPDQLHASPSAFQSTSQRRNQTHTSREMPDQFHYNHSQQHPSSSFSIS